MVDVSSQNGSIWWFYGLYVSDVYCLLSTGKPTKKDEPHPPREDRRKMDPSGLPPRNTHGPMPRSGPGSRGHGPGGHPIHPPHGPPMGPPGGYGQHKDIKLTLLNKVTNTGLLLEVNFSYPNPGRLQVMSLLSSLEM